MRHGPAASPARRLTLLTLRAEDARAHITADGAELRAWSIGGRDLLWNPDPSVWDAVAPILFPVVGWTRDAKVRVGGVTYPLDLHGFARHRRFVIADIEPNRLVLTDDADDNTRAMFPFDYHLALAFSLSASALRCVATIRNEGSGPMPYAFGLHPGFRWPAGDTRIIFDEAEAPEVPIITSDGLFSNERRSVPLAGRDLPVTRELLAREALCFLSMRSRGVTYEAKGFGRLHVAHEDMAHLALWSRPPAPFLCVESWTGHGDPAGFSGDLFEKPSMRVLAPGESARHAVTYTYASL